VSPFELKYLGELPSDNSKPPSGPYKGTINVRQEGRPQLRVPEYDVELVFTSNGKPV
jgi:hypothetical protein